MRRDIVRLGFLDQAASAALVAVARRQDALNRSAWQGLAEAGHVIDEIRRGGPMGLVSMVHTYAEGGTLRTTSDDLVIALVRSDVELSQTERDDARRATLVTRIEALAGGCADVRSTITIGAGRAPLLPTAGDLRAARQVEIRAAVDALLDDKAGSSAGSATERLGQRTGPTDRLHIVAESDLRRPTTANACTKRREIVSPSPTGSALKRDPLHRVRLLDGRDIAQDGDVFPSWAGTAVRRTLVQMPGSVDGADRPDSSGSSSENRITHQLFVSRREDHRGANQAMNSEAQDTLSRRVCRRPSCI